MIMLNNLPLKDARPHNQAHLLLWDNPQENELMQLSFYHNAQRINYRENLLSRIYPDQSFLSLHHYLDRELDAIKSLCMGVNKSIVLLEGLDCFITYLHVQGHNISLFWSNLEQTRKLETLLWILIPSNLAPGDWPKERLQQINLSI